MQASISGRENEYQTIERSNSAVPSQYNNARTEDIYTSLQNSADAVELAIHILASHVRALNTYSITARRKMFQIEPGSTPRLRSARFKMAAGAVGHVISAGVTSDDRMVAAEVDVANG